MSVSQWVYHTNELNDVQLAICNRSSPNNRLVFIAIISNLSLTFCSIKISLHYWSSLEINMWIFSATDLSACTTAGTLGVLITTALQRIDTTTASSFVWKDPTLNVCGLTECPLSYRNWGFPDPNYGGGGAAEHCACLTSTSTPAYTWADLPCTMATCSLCELDLWAWVLHTCHFICNYTVFQ